MLKARGVKITDLAAVNAYIEEKKQAAEAAAKEKAEAAAEAERLAREANPTTEDLLKQILAEIKNKQ